MDMPAAGRQIPNDYAFRLMWLYKRKFDGTVSNFGFGTKRNILKGNLTDMCQILTLELEAMF